MYAIVEIAGEQIRATAGQAVVVNRLKGEPGQRLTFDKVLLTVDNDRVVRAPNATVTASIIDHFKGEKVIVFKKKRRKGYKVKRGHRQRLTSLLIESINS